MKGNLAVAATVFAAVALTHTQLARAQTQAGLDIAAIEEAANPKPIKSFPGSIASPNSITAAPLETALI